MLGCRHLNARLVDGGNWAQTFRTGINPEDPLRVGSRNSEAAIQTDPLPSRAPAIFARLEKA
jgi:hypothetical protein